MTEGFDKEIDALLRQTARAEIAAPQIAAHIDADEISLFAENALSVKTRARVVAHLADCAMCRTILANVITLNSENADEIVDAEIPNVAAETPIPWYRKIFMFPSLAYAMGGLVVLLAGMIGFVALQNFSDSREASIAQVEKSGARRAADDEIISESQSSNSASSPSKASNTSAPLDNAANGETERATATTKTPAVSAGNAATAAKPPAPVSSARSADDERLKTADNLTANELADDANRRNYSFSREQNTADSGNIQSRQTQELPVNGRRAMGVLRQAPPAAKDAETATMSARSANDEAKKPEAAAKSAPPEKVRTVAGKKFTLKNGVWSDADYKQQKTVNLRRSSADYRKLDAALRAIADQLGGTVLIVWNGTAYQIQ